MPKLPTYIQEPMPLYPVVEQLDRTHGVITATLEDLPNVSPDHRITLGRLANRYGQQLGPADGIEEADEDILLEVSIRDFAKAEPKAIARGLYIPHFDPRFRESTTEQLVRVTPKGTRFQTGVVFPSDEFHLVARNAPDLAKHVMAKTRRANEDNPDRGAVEGTVGRSAAHAMESKIQGLNKLENELIETRQRLLIPLYRETYSSWQSHFKAKNLDKKRKEFDEELHDTVETASINLDLSSTALKAVHRAITSNLYRRGSSAEINSQWQNYIALVGHYFTRKRAKVIISRDQCQQEFTNYEPFLSAQPAS